MKLNDSGWILWKFAGADLLIWQVGELRKTLWGIWPDRSDEEIEREIFRYFIPDDYINASGDTGTKSVPVQSVKFCE
jgi:hypothetical protein